VRKILPALYAGLFAISVLGQQASTAPVFEVASIKPSEPGAQGTRIAFQPGGRLVTQNASLADLLALAYNLPGNRISGGPGWLWSDRYDVVAKPESPINTAAADAMKQLRQMLQALLVERFKVEIHWGTREVPLYALVVAKDGPRLKAAPGTSEDGGVSLSRGKLVGRAPMARLARELSNVVGRPVVDETGLQGHFELKLEWTPEQNLARAPPRDGEITAPMDDPGTSIFVALQEQLGLRLQTQRGPVPVLIVDHADKPSAN